MLEVVDLRCEYKVNPIGIDVRRPRISWKLKTDERAVLQTAYEIEVAADAEFSRIIWSSGKVESDQSTHVEIVDVQIASSTRYYYRVKSWSNKGDSSDWSAAAFWETGLLHTSDWSAHWIGAPAEVIAEDAEQSPLLRKSFELKADIRQARIYTTALGLYELELNGARVGDSYFTPGWTSYNHRLQVQTYDVTSMLQEGENAIGAMLGKGWYSGNLGWQDQKDIYGSQIALLLQMHIWYEDGSVETIATDEQWLASASPVLMSEIYHGETYDARLEQPGWSEAGFHDSAWQQAVRVERGLSQLVAQENEPVRKTGEIKPIALIQTPKGETVIDFGQNMVGWVRFRVRGDAGSTIEIHHAEVLDNDGNFYMENMRSAKVTICYTLKGADVETYEPRFTFQGFRYIRLIGFDAGVQLGDFTGIVLHSDMPAIGTFECSDPLINQLQHNIEWGLKGNFLDVPTDCPQRDERLGWTGDAQMFIRTATYLYNVAPFFTKWSRDLAADQLENGGVPFVIPNVLSKESHSSSAWGDAAVIVPWTLYMAYGDQRILEEQYSSMKAWVSYIQQQGDNPFLWNTGFHFGDWLGLDAKPDSYVGATDRDYIATAFYAYSTSLLQKTAAVLGKTEDAEYYAKLYADIVAAYTEEFVTPAGRLSVSTQTAQVLALMFGLLQGKAKERAVAKLMELMEESKFHLTTGFVGTPYLNHVLSDHGQLNTAYRLLFQQDYPSWLYQVTKGATTIWEHWDGIREDGSFWSKDMNSYNHYAYGAIGDWMYRCVAGIDTDEEKAGYKHIFVRPQPGDQLSWADGSLNTMYGSIRSKWSRAEDGAMELLVVIPPNTTATIVLPGADSDKTMESEIPLQQTEGISSVEQVENGVSMLAGSGEYRFTW
ncbi:family 78 glycoside hydrolase catalytic domain [Paenibacillus sp. GXUN7292]|uniref:family 78 glycoside hydrolase catalytic domain n=1 Tax=Paenibacillus sp. GXUN7292 TaxID=3422499 RepID=UPI003D7D2389